jgi:hypothetical protein
MKPEFPMATLFTVTVRTPPPSFVLRHSFDIRH